MHLQTRLHLIEEGIKRLDNQIIKRNQLLLRLGVSTDTGVLPVVDPPKCLSDISPCRFSGVKTVRKLQLLQNSDIEHIRIKLFS